jgi:hypothetical protein
VSEDAEIGTFVHKLTANDPDITSTDLLEYALDAKLTTAVSEDGTEVPNSHEFAEYFSVDKAGSVSVHKKLRRDLFAVRIEQFINLIFISLRLKLAKSSFSNPLNVAESTEF